MFDHGDAQCGQTCPPSYGFVVAGFGQPEQTQIIEFAAHIVERMAEMKVDEEVEQEGVACHTGRRSCFFRAVRDGKLVEIAAPVVSPEALYGQSGHSRG